VTPWRRRAALVLLPLALVTTGFLLWRTIPTDRDLVIDLGDPAGVRRVAVTYWRVDAPDERGGFSRVFATSAPRRLHHPVSLRPGNHVVEIRVERFASHDGLENTVKRHVSITGREVIVFAPPLAPRAEVSRLGERFLERAEPVPRECSAGCPGGNGPEFP